MPDAGRAIHDRRLDVRIESAVPLRFRGGADRRTDRPAHVRAASGLVIAFGAAWVVQDDAQFLARIDLSSGEATALPLPAERGRRQLSKAEKLDLECLVSLGSLRAGLLALGSGSTARRRRAIQIGLSPGAEPVLIDATDLYVSLERDRALCEGTLNLEGAVVYHEARTFRVRLFQRGNGRKGRPANATCEIGLADLLQGRAARPERVTRWDLGAIDGVPLAFTDANADRGGVTYLAVAEDSPDAIADGPVVGAAIGRIEEDGGARYGLVHEKDGEPARRKLEGLAWDASRKRWLAVDDKDDPDLPSELLSLVPARGVTSRR